MRNKLFSLITAFMTVLAVQGLAQQTVKVTSSGIGYLEYLPQGYNSNSNNYPVVISLHGIKEKGTSSTDPNKVKLDVPRVANVGLPRYVKQGQQYPFILISPQLKSNMGRWTGPFIMEVLNHVKKYLRIDTRRVYLTGLSLGGGGVWTVAVANPDVFAAIVPICSGYNELSKANNLASKDVPVWAFHGNADNIVSYTVSQKMVNAINGCSPKPSPLSKLTIFAGMNHIIWDKVYKQTDALNWMLGHKKGTSAPSSPTNSSPTVNAGADKTITLPSNSVAIQASASDGDGSIASWRWSKLSGGSVSMSGTTSSKLTVSNLVAGIYSFRVTVEDNDGASKSDDVQVVVKSSSGSSSGSTTTNKLPTVNAGSDKSTTRNAITLVGYASDPDGSIASWLWTKVSGPSASMSNQNTSKLWAYNLMSGTYVFRLTVKDNKGASRYDDIKLTVNNGTTAPTADAGQPTGTNTSPSGSNALPTVNAGSDKTTTNSGFTLVGYANDPDGSIASWLWTKVSGPGVSIKNATTSKAWVHNLVSGTYIFRLTVKDNDGASKYDEVKLVVSNGQTASTSTSTTTTPTSSNKAPTAYAGTDKQTTNSGFTIVGNGSDADGSIASYKWSKVSGPAVSMSNTSSPKLWAYNLVSGTYVFRLTVKDNDGATDADEMKLVVKSSATTSSTKAAQPNKAPIAYAGLDKTITYPKRAITLVGSAIDVDGSVVSLRWHKLSGGTASLEKKGANKLWAHNLKPGTYKFRLTAKDNDGAMDYDDVKLIVRSSTASLILKAPGARLAKAGLLPIETSSSAVDNAAPVQGTSPDALVSRLRWS